ncbi:hypothetical protein [Mycoplasma testudineum]|uniref:hypothetical protein n=1 Tax=Mycoplasma testudineum TaxID=244584 RepID=UPI0014152188|nr:hypothetical protein [Mycoplasma testudineum]
MKNFFAFILYVLTATLIFLVVLSQGWIAIDIASSLVGLFLFFWALSAFALLKINKYFLKIEQDSIKFLVSNQEDLKEEISSVQNLEFSLFLETINSFFYSFRIWKIVSKNAKIYSMEFLEYSKSNKE